MATASTRLWLPEQAYYGPKRLREQQCEFAFTTEKNNKFMLSIGGHYHT